MTRQDLIKELMSVMDRVTTVAPDTYLLLCKTLRLAQTYKCLSNDIIIGIANVCLPEEFQIEV